MTSNICFICQSNDDNDDSGDLLVNPCNCRGTMQHVHSHCLTSWIKISGNHRCNQCQIPYLYTKEYEGKLSISLLYLIQKITGLYALATLINTILYFAKCCISFYLLHQLQYGPITTWESLGIFLVSYGNIINLTNEIDQVLRRYYRRHYYSIVILVDVNIFINYYDDYGRYFIGSRYLMIAFYMINEKMNEYIDKSIVWKFKNYRDQVIDEIKGDVQLALTATQQKEIIISLDFAQNEPNEFDFTFQSPVKDSTNKMITYQVNIAENTIYYFPSHPDDNAINEVTTNYIRIDSEELDLIPLTDSADHQDDDENINATLDYINKVHDGDGNSDDNQELISVPFYGKTSYEYQAIKSLVETQYDVIKTKLNAQTDYKIKQIEIRRYCRFN